MRVRMRTDNATDINHNSYPEPITPIHPESLPSADIILSNEMNDMI